MPRKFPPWARQCTWSDDLAVKDLPQSGKRHLKGLSVVLRCENKQAQTKTTRQEAVEIA
jgi:hypothetical protein